MQSCSYDEPHFPSEHSQLLSGSVPLSVQLQLSQQQREGQGRQVVAAVHDFSCQRPDGKLLFQNLSFEVHQGDIRRAVQPQLEHNASKLALCTLMYRAMRLATCCDVSSCMLCILLPAIWEVARSFQSHCHLVAYSCISAGQSLKSSHYWLYPGLPANMESYEKRQNHACCLLLKNSLPVVCLNKTSLPSLPIKQSAEQTEPTGCGTISSNSCRARCQCISAFAWFVF